MRVLLGILLIISFGPNAANAKVSASICHGSAKNILIAITQTDHAGEMRNVNKWLRESREFHQARKGDPTVHVTSVETARKYAYFFPGLEYFGFGQVNKLNWTRVVGRIEASGSKGKLIGWERKLSNGNWARVRIDYSPELRTHYNIEVRVKKGDLAYETHNLAVAFACGNHPCSHEEYLKLLDVLN